jgi:uncharacterized protein (DUF885 family)
MIFVRKIAGAMCLLILVAGASPCTTRLKSPAQTAQTKDITVRRKALSDLLAEQWEFTLRESPELATTLGDSRYNDRWSDQSIEGQRRIVEASKKFRNRYEAIDTTGLTEDEKLNKALSVQAIDDLVEGFRLKLYLLPVDQQNGAQLNFPNMVSSIPFNSVKDYENYQKRLTSLPRVLDQIIEVLKEGKRQKMMPPKFVLPSVVEQCNSIAQPSGESSPFGAPVAHFPDTVPVAERTRLHDSIIQAVDQQVRPAYLSLAKFIQNEYAPYGRTEPGMWSLPHGDRLYRYAIWTQTSTWMTPEAIHALGKKEVSRIQAEMLSIAKQFGFSTRKAFQDSLRKNPKLFVATREQYLDLYRKYIAQMEPMLPRLFGRLPKAKVIVQAVESYREDKASGPEYNPGSPDGSRSGHVMVNTSDLAHRSTLTAESTTYHESIPGHHMQISIAQNLPELPPFRQNAFYTSYVEGWALYAEQLGKEVGFYQDPLSEYGRLTDELLRACRLVLDTGVHRYKWSRQQMVDYFRENSNEDEPNIQSETDRYIVGPGQALAYKLGQLDILRLREKAKRELGTKFDIRSFHDEILGGGALPLSVLDARIDKWINSSR